MKNKIISFLFIFLLIFLSISIIPVSGVSDYFIYGFEGSTVGSEVFVGESQFFVTTTLTGTSTVSDTLAYSKDKSYSISSSSSAQFSFHNNYIDWETINGSSLWVYYGGASGDLIFQWRNVAEVKISMAMAETGVVVLGKSGHNTMLVTGDMRNQWHRIGWDYINTTNVSYWFENSTYSTEIVWDAYVTSNPILYMNNVYLQTVGTNNMYVDLFQANGDDNFYDIPLCDEGLDSIGQIGIEAPAVTTLCNNRYLWFRYYLIEDMFIKSLYLQLDEAHRNMETNDYALKINQYNLGYADSLELISGNRTILVWENLDLHIQGKTTFLFKALSYIDLLGYHAPTWPWEEATYDCIRYWQLPLTDIDTNNDGTMGIRTLGSGFDGLWDTFADMYNEYPGGWGETIDDFDLILRLCVSREGSGEIQDYDNAVYAYPQSVEQYNSVDITWTVNRSSMGYNKEIYVNDVLSKVLHSQSSHYYYIPKQEGLYYVNLSVNDVIVDTTQFNVSGTPENYIYTSPNPSSQGGIFNIYYAYNYTAYNGSIRIFDKNNNIVREFSVISDTVGSFSTFIENSGQYMVTLSMKLAEYSYNDVDISIHVVEGENTNKLTLDKYDVSLYDVVTTYYSHSHAGQNVYVKIGNTYSDNIGSTGRGVYTYIPITGGTFPVSLVLVLDNEEIELATTNNLVVTDTTEVEVDSIFPEMPSDIGWIIGVFITLLFICIPFLLGLTFKSYMDMPKELYGITGGLGVVISTIIGCWGWEVPFFIIVIFVLILLLTYFTRK